MSAHEHASDLLFELADVETLPTELARVLHVRIVDPTAVGRAMLVLLREFKALATKVSDLGDMLEAAAEVGYEFAVRNDPFGDLPYLGDDTSREYMRSAVETFCDVFEKASLRVELRGMRSQPTEHQRLDANGDTWSDAAKRLARKHARKVARDKEREAHEMLQRKRAALAATIVVAQTELTQLG